MMRTPTQFSQDEPVVTISAAAAGIVTATLTLFTAFGWLDVELAAAIAFWFTTVIGLVAGLARSRVTPVRASTVDLVARILEETDPDFASGSSSDLDGPDPATPTTFH